ncbi:MAG: glyoxalase [Leptolyngbyaceae cyanobacterium bins.349]|nr:glyoxalase [Leptolyngbyaceae cyanobacterium bins.349]
MPLTHTAAFLTISTPNFDRLVAFYQQFLDQAPVTFRPNVYAEFQLPGMRLGIFRPKEGKESGVRDAGGMGLCIEVANLESAIAHLTQLGYPPGAIMTASHGREVYANDPDGNWLILHQGHPHP